MSFFAAVQNDGYVVCEQGGLCPWHWKRHDVVIGMTRSPFGWYSTLWAHLSEAEGTSIRALHPEVLSREVPHGATEEDRMRFRNFVRLVSTSGLGLMSLHMWINYIYTHTSPESRLLLAPSLGRRRLLRERIGGTRSARGVDVPRY